MLVANVAKPMLQPVIVVRPCANTVQGLTPYPAAINKASPNPKIANPIIRKKTDVNGGFSVSALGELQNNTGIPFTLRNFKFNNKYSTLFENLG
jgi:hypothetical protein